MAKRQITEASIERGDAPAPDMFDVGAADADQILIFTEAKRQGSRTITTMYAESNGGKTYSALLYARGLVGPKGRIALVDTENRRALIYAEVGAPWDHAELTEPFTPERHVTALKNVAAAKYDALILDSGSHCWDDLGGVLESAAASTVKGLGKWQLPKLRHKRFVRQLLRSPMHIVICLRAKEKLVDKIIDGKKEIVSAGYVPIQAKDFIYDTTVQLFMTGRGFYRVEKCPEELLPAFDVSKPITIETGEKVREWVKGGAVVDKAYEALREAAYDAASRGTVSLREWFMKLDKAQRGRVKPLVDTNLKSVAEHADAAAKEAMAEQDDSMPGNYQDDGQKRPPFLDSAIKDAKASRTRSELMERQVTTVDTIGSSPAFKVALAEFNEVCLQRLAELPEEE